MSDTDQLSDSASVDISTSASTSSQSTSFPTRILVRVLSLVVLVLVLVLAAACPQSCGPATPLPVEITHAIDTLALHEEAISLLKTYASTYQLDSFQPSTYGPDAGSITPFDARQMSLSDAEHNIRSGAGLIQSELLIRSFYSSSSSPSPPGQTWSDLYNRTRRLSRQVTRHIAGAEEQWTNITQQGGWDFVSSTRTTLKFLGTRLKHDLLAQQQAQDLAEEAIFFAGLASSPAEQTQLLAARASTAVIPTLCSTPASAAKLNLTFTFNVHTGPVAAPHAGDLLHYLNWTVVTEQGGTPAWGYCQPGRHLHDDTWSSSSSSPQPPDLGEWYDSTRDWTPADFADTAEAIAPLAAGIRAWRARPLLDDDDDDVDHPFVCEPAYRSGEDLALLALLRHLVGAYTAAEDVLALAPPATLPPPVMGGSGGGGAGASSSGGRIWAGLRRISSYCGLSSDDNAGPGGGEVTTPGLGDGVARVGFAAAVLWEHIEAVLGGLAAMRRACGQRDVLRARIADLARGDGWVRGSGRVVGGERDVLAVTLTHGLLLHPTAVAARFEEESEACKEWDLDVSTRRWELMGEVFKKRSGLKETWGEGEGEGDADGDGDGFVGKRDWRTYRPYDEPVVDPNQAERLKERQKGILDNLENYEQQGERQRRRRE